MIEQLSLPYCRLVELMNAKPWNSHAFRQGAARGCANRRQNTAAYSGVGKSVKGRSS